MVTTATKILYQQAATCPNQTVLKNLQYTLAQTFQMLITFAVVEAQKNFLYWPTHPGNHCCGTEWS